MKQIQAFNFIFTVKCVNNSRRLLCRVRQVKNIFENFYFILSNPHYELFHCRRKKLMSYIFVKTQKTKSTFHKMLFKITKKVPSFTKRP